MSPPSLLYSQPLYDLTPCSVFYLRQSPKNVFLLAIQSLSLSLSLRLIPQPQTSSATSGRLRKCPRYFFPISLRDSFTSIVPKQKWRGSFFPAPLFSFFLVTLLVEFASQPLTVLAISLEFSRGASCCCSGSLSWFSFPCLCVCVCGGWCFSFCLSSYYYYFVFSVCACMCSVCVCWLFHLVLIPAMETRLIAMETRLTVRCQAVLINPFLSRCIVG